MHAAAGSGFKLLQGLGILGSDTSGTTINVVIGSLNAMPADMRAELVGTSDVIDIEVTRDVTK